MQRNPVGWFEIYVQDMARARAFYEKVLGVQLQKLDDTGMEYWAFPSQPDGAGAGGALAKFEGAPSGGNSTVVYFSCADCAAEAGRVPANGGKVFKEKFSVGQYGFVTLVTDPDGNMIGLHSMK